MNRSWSIEKKDINKSVNEFFVSSSKLFLIVLPVLLLLSIFFILVGVLDDKEALEYGIPCIVSFLVISLYLLILYFVQLFTMNKKCVMGQYSLYQQDEKSFLYQTNNKEAKKLELYKIYNLKKYYLIFDFNSKDIIIIPKNLEDLDSLINQLKIGASTKIILNKFQIIFLVIVILIFCILCILM